MKIQTTLPGLRLRPILGIHLERLLRLETLAILLFPIWSLLFIWKSSFVAIDGQRYFSLLDDAMISMRYAWNFSHGLGLVWNAGQAVEGYSNLLMTLIMSATTALLDKKLAVLAMQLLGIPTVLGVVFLTRRVAHELYENDRIADLAFIGILFYVPLAYWSLMGMEAGLLTLLILAAFLSTILYMKNRRLPHLWLTAFFLGLAFLTRNESLLLAGLIFVYLAFRLWQAGAKRKDFLLLADAVLIYGLFVAGQLFFRFWYYGQLVPNTYTLKVTGIPLSLKLLWGYEYVRIFLEQSAVLLGVALLEIVRSKGRTAILMLFLAVLLVYQVSVGGDSFGLWRILLPGMPLIFILVAAWLVMLYEWLRPRLQTAGQQVAFAALPLVLLLAQLTMINAPILNQIYNASGQNKQALANQHNVDVAIGIDQLTTPNASIGVIWAGTIPYYTGYRAIDFLGKADAYIASQPAHLESSLIGHNKYDLHYSIHTLQPTYIQTFKWGRENLKPWIVRHYLRANYATLYGDITLILKGDDPSVLWEKATIIPWAEEK